MAASKRAVYALLLFFALASCGTVPSNIRVYYLDPAQGLVRKQVNEVLPFAQAKGYFCQSPKDFEDTVGCVGGAVKVYSLQPAMGGIYRKQANELLTYLQARGYFCASPQDFKQILDRCPAR